MAKKKTEEEKRQDQEKRRLDKVQKITRIRQVCGWMMDGHNSQDIIYQIQTTWNLSSRQPYTYINWALEWFEKSVQAKIEERRAVHIAARMKMYKDVLEDKALKAKDRYSTALTILQDVARLEGMYKETIKIESEHTENYKITLNLGDSEQQEQIKERTIQLLPTSDNELSEGDS